MLYILPNVRDSKTNWQWPQNFSEVEKVSTLLFQKATRKWPL